MATIQFVINAINNASRVFNDVADSAAKLDGALKATSDQADKTNIALGNLADGAKLATAAFDDVMLSASKAQAAMDAAGGAAADLRDELVTAKVAVSSLTDSMQDLRTSTLAAAAAQKTLGGSVLASGTYARGAYGMWFSLWRLLANAGKIPLFGGLLGAIGPLHLAIDLFGEFLAVVIPVTIALTAWGFAAAESFGHVYTQMLNMNTIAVATNRSIGPLTGTFAKLQDAVQPSVYQLFGDALNIAAERTGEFYKVASSVGVVLDNLGARFTVAATSGNQFGVFMSHAVSDIAKVGDVLASLGSIIAQPLKVLPGYAEVLLTITDGLTHFLALIAQSIDPVFKWGLALHGAYIYMGLAVTGVMKLGPALVRLGIWFAGVITATYGYISALVALAIEEGVVATAMMVLESINPLVWVAVGVAALVGLVVWLRNAKTATQDYIAEQQKMVMNSNVGSGLVTIMQAQNDVAQKLAGAEKTLADTQEYVNQVNTHTGASTRSVSAAYTAALANVNALKGGYTNLGDQANLYSYRLNSLGKQFGGTAAASGLLVAAGVTMNQMLNKNSENWHEIEAMVAGVAAGYKTMGQQGGALGNSLQVMDIQANDQYQDMQKLNQAWDTFIGNATKTQSGFDTWAMGMKTIGSSAAQITTHLGDAKLAISGYGSAIDGLTNKDLALNQAFTTQITNANAMIDTWRSAGLSNDVFTRGVKDSIAPMVKYAEGSKEATDQLIALAEEAGYQGPASLSSLVKWLGNTSNAMQTVKDTTDKATEQEALLTSALNGQGNLIANKIIGDIDNAILAYKGVYTAATNYGNAIAKDGAQSNAAHAARQTLIDDIISSGKAAGESTTQIAGMIAKILKIPLSRAIKIVMEGDGSFSIKGSEGLPAVHGISTKIPGAAGGMYVTRGRAGVDDQLILAQRGELVIPSHMVKAGAADHLRGKIPGFAAGGLVDTGNMNVLTGQKEQSDYVEFQNTMETAQIDAMRSAIKSAQAALQGVGGHSGNVQSYARDVLLILSQLHQPSSALNIVLSQMQTESGGNPTIVNKWDSNWAAGTPSVGLMQVIGPTFDSYAGPYRSVGPYEYGVSVNPMANIYAGLNYAIHRYPGYWESVLGHGHGYAAGGLINEPIIGIGRSGQMYGFGEAGPEMVVPWALNKLGPPGPAGFATGSPVFNSSPFIGAGGSGGSVLPGMTVKPAKKTVQPGGTNLKVSHPKKTVQPGGTNIPLPVSGAGGGGTSTGTATSTSDGQVDKDLQQVIALLGQIVALLQAAPGQQGNALARALNGTSRRVGAQPGGPIRPY